MEACPELAHRSGIYFYIREDLEGKHAYIGKAVDLIERSISHLVGHSQRIDISLKKRGFHSTVNPTGWVLNVLYYPKNELDGWERHWIARYREAGYDLYNVESGGSDGKEIIGQRKPPKTYRDGLEQGQKNLARDLRHIVATHLTVTTKNDSKNAVKALEKFWKLIGGNEENV